MSILVTGFEPFDQRAVNQSEVMARAIDPNALILPVTFSDCWKPVEAWLKQNADARTFVISLGEAPVKDLRMEVVALNKKHAPERGDNKGEAPYNEPLDENGPLALQGSLTPEKLNRILSRKNFKCDISFSAGQYVCNALYYYLLQQQSSGKLRAAFFHLPVEMDNETFSSIQQRLKYLLGEIEKGEV